MVDSLAVNLRQGTAMAALSSLHYFSPIIGVKPQINPGRVNFDVRSQHNFNKKSEGGGHRRVWRRRKLKPWKKDETLEYRLERFPFLEEQVRQIRGGGKIISMDIERLLLSEDNRFDFVNEVAAEAKAYVESNRDEYGAKKAILHVLSNRMNDAGLYRPEAYLESDPFKPGPGYLREEL